MRKFAQPPFTIDLSSLAQRARRFVRKRVDGASISLPFVSFSVSPTDIEKKIAREILIRLKDKRVLCSAQCCHSCTQLALKSLNEVRAVLVDKQVELSEFTDGPLYLLIDYMLVGIRDFLTFEESLRAMPMHRAGRHLEFERAFSDYREEYLSSLEQLRAHVVRCLQQVSTIADLPKDESVLPMRYSAAWQLHAYKGAK